MKKLRLAILISGSGSTMEAIVKSSKSGKLKSYINPVVVISSKADALGIKKAKKLKVPVEIVKDKSLLLKTLKKYKPDIVSQNGWLPLTPVEVIKEYENKIFNQHPAPLDPENHLHFGGKGMYGLAVHAAVLDFQKKANRRFPTEATIHKVTEKFDEGDVVARRKVPVYSSDTPQLLASRVLPVEHELFIEFLEKEYKGLNKVQKRKSPLIKKTEEKYLHGHRILILGSGAREDALAWKLRQSPEVSDVFVSKTAEVVKLCRELDITFVVVGPEDALQQGIVDQLIKSKIEVYGPVKKAAVIEGSKVFSTGFMHKYNIPQPKYHTFNSFDKANKFLDSKQEWFKKGIVVKADGLALGKGAIVCKNLLDAKKALKLIMIDKQFNDAGNSVVIQQRLKGFEVSVTVVSDGNKYLVLPFTEDHKQAYDGDLGPNTGGMGVAAPHQLVDKKLSDKIIKRIIEPTLKNLKKEGREFKGTLFPGLMIENGQPYVLEFNARFGDPEIESILPLLPSNLDFFKILYSAARGKLIKTGVLKIKKTAITVTLASKGYPLSYKKGIPIEGLDKKLPNDIYIFHAGVEKTDNGYVTSGGRVLMVTAVANSIGAARKKAYEFINKKSVYFSGMHYRKDIGARIR